MKSRYNDIQLRGEDSLNLHDETIYILRKDGHYDYLYKDNNNFNVQMLKDTDVDFLNFCGINVEN